MIKLTGSALDVLPKWFSCQSKYAPLVTDLRFALFNPERNLFSVYMIPEGNFIPE